MTLEKIIGAKVSMGVKKDAVDVDTFLYRLYNDEDSPLYHGFIFEMRENMKDSILFMNGKFDLETFPPSNETIKKLKMFGNENSEECFDGLVVKRDHYHPYHKNGHDPPKKSSGEGP